MRLFSLLIVCVLGTSAFAEVTFVGKMPEDLMPEMREIIDSALTSSEGVWDRDLAETAAEGRRIASRSAILPSFRTNVSFRKEQDEDSVISSYEDRVVYNVTLSQPLYHWGARRAEMKVGKLQYESEILSTEQAMERILNSVRRSYMSLVVAKRTLARSRASLEDAQEKLAYQQELVESELAGKATLLPLEIDVDRKQIGLLRELSSWEFKLDELSLLSGIDVDRIEVLIVDDIPKFEPLPEDELAGLGDYFADAAEADEDLKKRDLGIEIQKQRLKIQEQALKPKIDAQIGLSSNALDLNGTRREQSYSYFGLSVGWNIFDGFRKRGNTLEALSNLNLQERSKNAFERSLMRKYQRLAKALEIEGRSLALQETYVRTREGSVEWARLGVEEGRSSARELDDLERAQESLQIETLGVRVNYLMALSELASELGLDSRLIP